MQEMSEVLKCLVCRQEFDSQTKIPKILPCRHLICFLCASDQYQKIRSIKCAQEFCKQVHRIQPFLLQTEEILIKQLEEKETLDSIALLENQQSRVRSAQKQLLNCYQSFIQQLIQHIQTYIFKDNLALQKQLSQLSKTINLKLKHLKRQQIKTDQQELTQQENQQNITITQLEEQVQKALVDVRRVIQQDPVLSSKIFEELSNVKHKLDPMNQDNINYQNQINQQNNQLQSLQQEILHLQGQLNIQIQDNQELKQKLQTTQSQIQYKNQNFQITIASPNNKKVQASVMQDTTIRQIKDKIQEQTKLQS